MNILAIDTSTNVLGVGIVSHEKIIGEYITNIKRNHSTRVLPAIDYLLKDCQMNIKDINKIVVANGPGSYTGLRIGVTIGKSLAWTLNIPVVGVSTLMVMAASARFYPGIISPIIDARRGNVFTGLYAYENGIIRCLIEDQHVGLDQWIEMIKQYDQPVLFLGNDAELHKETIERKLESNASFAPLPLNVMRPGELALLGKALDAEETHVFRPNYLRLSEAEAKWREKNRN